jgi:excisionase family DNA binding protein
MALQLLIGGQMNSDLLLSVEQAALRLGGLSRWTIYAWLSQGKLQRTKVGSRTMIRESELAKVIQEGGKSPAPGNMRPRFSKVR